MPRSRIAVAGAISAFACLTLPGAAAAQQPMVPAMDVAGVETVPIDGDIDHYRAVLVETEEGADLYIFTEAGSGWQQAVHAPEIVWRGSLSGQGPWLEATESGSLKIHSENSSVGRDRWEQVLTIAYRKGEFQVAGYTYTYYETLDPDHNGVCDVNLLTGKGTHKGKSFKTALPATVVGNWTMDTRPPECAPE
ncbi:hypothetical protein [Roseibium salinum]|uniref:Uncharacterized protein n=1 Tax=Roseibium salinum TaxID=1604349 RepID=A0ABT3QZN9_9HYPH|nr:hypothetical protein [Roseibium sp. DSM 29163]MCX2722430.1 hypothetical protein [Roseibium sp. DSM 29163]